MSEMEYNKGKLIPFEYEMTEEKAKEIIVSSEDSLWCESWLQQLQESTSDYLGSVECIHGKFYHVKWEVRGGELDEIINVNRQPDGSITFETYHYNGGGHWTEVVEQGLRK